MEKDQNVEKKPRRKYTDKFKAELVAEYMQGGSSLTSIAVKNGMNPNVLHRWVNEHERFGKHDLSEFSDSELDAPEITVSNSANNWLAILPQQSQSVTIPQCESTTKNSYTSHKKVGDIGLEINSSKLELKLSWPSNDHSGLAGFIKELMA